MHTLIIKGDETAAFTACSLHNMEVTSIVHRPVFNDTIVTVPATVPDANLVTWFCSEPSEPPYPDGALLWYGPAKQEVQDNDTNAAIDYALEKFILELAPDSPGAKEIVARREKALQNALDEHFAKRRAYQGVNTLCARCGQPIQGDAVPSAEDRMLFYYCGEACRDAH